MTPGRDAQALIDRLGLQRHPEGGWYRETWRDGAGGDTAVGRGHASLILFLLASGEHSHWHRIDASELWLFHAGAPLTLRIAQPGVPAETITVSAEQPQAIVPARAWQAAETTGDWTLVGCVVAPGFRFEGFELAPPGWEPGAISRQVNPVRPE